MNGEALAGAGGERGHIDEDASALHVVERARDGLARGEADRAHGAAVAARRGHEVPAGGRRLRDRGVGALPDEAARAGAVRSASEKLWEIASGPPVSEKPNVCGSAEGVVTTSTRMVPRLAWVNVQVTTSPGASAIEAGAEPSLHVADTRSQPAGSGLCAAAYVPGFTATELVRRGGAGRARTPR